MIGYGGANRGVLPLSEPFCEKHDGQTVMRRLDEEKMADWLENYRLGELWSSGEIGGNP